MVGERAVDPLLDGLEAVDGQAFLAKLRDLLPRRQVYRGVNGVVVPTS